MKKSVSQQRKIPDQISVVQGCADYVGRYVPLDGVSIGGHSIRNRVERKSRKKSRKNRVENKKQKMWINKKQKKRKEYQSDEPRIPILNSYFNNNTQPQEAHPKVHKIECVNGFFSDLLSQKRGAAENR